MITKNSFTILLFVAHCSLQASDITIGFMGDIMLGRLVGKFLKKNNDYTYPWGNLLPLLRSTNFNMANLETTFTESHTKVPKTFNFKSDRSNVKALLEANIQIVNLANNHSFDFGFQGFLDTLAILDKNNILHIGAGIHKKEAQKPAFLTKNGLTFAFIGATDNEPGWAADAQKAGTRYLSFNEDTARTLSNEIKELKKMADFVIVSLHWGPNWDTLPSQDFQKFAHGILDAGADLIHGHSPHIFQGIEFYNNKLILYSTGDFLDDYAIDTLLRNDQSFLFLTTFDKEGLKELRLIPIILSNFQVNKAPFLQAKTMLSRIQELSLELGTTIPNNGIWQRKK